MSKNKEACWVDCAWLQADLIQQCQEQNTVSLPLHYRGYTACFLNSNLSRYRNIICAVFSFSAYEGGGWKVQIVSQFLQERHTLIVHPSFTLGISADNKRKFGQDTKIEQ